MNKTCREYWMRTAPSDGQKKRSFFHRLKLQPNINKKGRKMRGKMNKNVAQVGGDTPGSEQLATRRGRLPTCSGAARWTGSDNGSLAEQLTPSKVAKAALLLKCSSSNQRQPSAGDEEEWLSGCQGLLSGSWKCQRCELNFQRKSGKAGS